MALSSIVAALALITGMSSAGQFQGLERGASPGPSEAFDQMIAGASRRFAVPIEWLRGVMQVESGGDPRAISPKGAVGLMQVMPQTYAALRSRYALGPDPSDPADNVLAGAAYLREMYDRYGSPGFLAAYNAGPGRLEAWLARGRSLPPETVTYLSKLGPVVARSMSLSANTPSSVHWSDAALFTRRRLPKSDPNVREASQKMELSGFLGKPQSLFVQRIEDGEPN